MNEFKLQHRQIKIPILHFDLSSDFYVSKQLLISYVIMRRLSEVKKRQVFSGTLQSKSHFVALLERKSQKHSTSKFLFFHKQLTKVFFLYLVWVCGDVGANHLPKPQPRKPTKTDNGTCCNEKISIFKYVSMSPSSAVFRFIKFCFCPEPVTQNLFTLDIMHQLFHY